MLTGALGKLRTRVGGSRPHCPETDEPRTVQWLQGTPYCSECGQAMEADREFLRRRFSHPDQSGATTTRE